MHITILYQTPLEHTESIFSHVIVISVLPFNHSGVQMDRTEQYHIAAAFYIFSCFSSLCFAQAAKQATAARFIFNPNILRLPFNVWFSVGWALCNVQRTNTVETNYAL